MVAPVAVGLLGAVEIGRGGALAPVPGLKLQAVVAMLALAAPHPVGSERLIEEVWGEDRPANPSNALHAQIAQLRRLLGADAVVRREPGYALAVAPGDVDACRLEQLLHGGRDAARDGEHTVAAENFRAAIALVRGQPLAQLLDYGFARDAAARLGDLVLEAHEGLADACLAAGYHVEVATTLAELVRAHPLRERFHAQLILALYRGGRQADALRAYQDARTVLVEELGVEPGPELQELERAVLAHDPTLALEPTAVIAPANGSEARPSRLPLVGRDRELRALLADVGEACAGRGRVALLGGEPGIGKTRLAEEVAVESGARGATVVWGRCYEGRGAPAFWPWTQVVQGVLTHFGDDELRAALGGGIADVAQIAPEVKELVDEIEPLPPLDPESARFRLYQSVSRFVRHLASVRPIALVIDDLHWADESSMELLVFLANEVATTPMLVVATYRDVDPTIGAGLSNTIVELSRRPVTRRLDVTGLDPDALAQIFAAAGTEADDELLARVFSRTRGNPFFVTEILHLIPAEGGLEPDALSRAVPVAVQGIIRHRVGQLPDETQHAIGAAAVFGQDLDLGLLADVLDVDGATLLEHLEPAEQAGIIVERRSAPGRYRFSHGLVNETVYDELSAGRRARMHKRAAEALEARHGLGEGPHLVGLAAHWYHAVPAAPPDRGIDVACQASRWAQDHVAQRQAEELLRAALDLIGAIPQSTDRALREIAVQDQLGQLLIASTSYSGAEFGRVCVRVRELCQEIGGHPLMVPAMWRLTISHMMAAEIDNGLAVGGQLLELGQADTGSPVAVLVGHICSGTILMQRGDFLDARVHLDRAIELCDEGHDADLARTVTEDPAVFARVFAAMNAALLGDGARAEVLLEDGAVLAARDSPVTYGNFLVLWGRATVAMFLRDAATAMRYADDCMALSAAQGYAMGGPIGYIGALRCHGMALQGDIDEACDIVLQSAAALQSMGAVYSRPMFFVVHAEVSLMRSRFADALASADEGLRSAEATGELWCAADLHRVRGEALAGLDPNDPVVSEELRIAIRIATDQGAQPQLHRAHTSSERLARS